VGSSEGPWEECIGKTDTEACDYVKSCNPDVSCKFIAPGTPMPRNYDPTRVFIVHDDNNVVIQRCGRG